MKVIIDYGKELPKRILNACMVAAFLLMLVGTYLLVIGNVGVEKIYIGVLLLVLTLFGVIFTSGRKGQETVEIMGDWPLDYIVMTKNDADDFLSDQLQTDLEVAQTEINCLKAVEYLGKSDVASPARKKIRALKEKQEGIVRELMMQYSKEFGIVLE